MITASRRARATIARQAAACKDCALSQGRTHSVPGEGNPDADIHFVVTGTQANLMACAAMLRPYESVIAPVSGHIATHEAGAVEATGHKINAIPTAQGRLSCPDIEQVVQEHTDEHMVKPRAVFIAHATEVGTIALGVVAASAWLLTAILGFQQFGLPTVLLSLALAYAAADLVVSRSGATTCAELQAAGQALRALLENREVFDEAVAASQAGDAEKLRNVIETAGLLPYCRFICFFFCSWRCVLVCLTLCRQVPLTPIEQPLQEAFAFAKETAKLAGRPGDLERLSAAVGAGDPKAFAAIVSELKLQRFCIQLCHWICFLRCRRFCILVCPKPDTIPLFTHASNSTTTVAACLFTDRAWLV
jgi:hypothetical protein